MNNTAEKSTINLCTVLAIELKNISSQQNTQSNIWNAAIENLNVVLQSLAQSTSSELATVTAV